MKIHSSASANMLNLTNTEDTVASSHFNDRDDENTFSSFVWTQQWYPLLPVSLLEPTRSRPKQLTVLGRKLVIWNNGNRNSDNTWTVMKDVCPHRRAPLSTGKVLSNGSNDGCSNTLMCRFHGWQFDASGACIKIPMQPTDFKKGKDIKTTKTVHARTLQTQVKGGLLWAFLDETMDNPPVLSPNAYVDGDGSHMEYIVSVSPVSYLSNVENSFDPSHAPFIHEGVSEFGGRVFSPDDAFPMARYGLQNGTTLNVTGFTLEHTPYMDTPDINISQQITTRQFIPPCTQITKSTFFSAHLYFVPSTPRETLVIFSFPKLPSSESTKLLTLSKAMRLLKFVLPKTVQSKLASIEQDFQHYKEVNSDQQVRFVAQDTLTMQGQDFNKGYHKSMDKVVLDIAPVPADQGVSIFQRWIKRFAGGGPFSPNKYELVHDHSYQPTLSPWEAHMKHCPICQRSIHRMSRWGNLAKVTSKQTLVGSALLYMLATLASASKLSAIASRLSYVSLLTSITLQWKGATWRRNVEDAFVTQAHARHPKNDVLFQTYAE